jgi:hypothetical protein
MTEYQPELGQMVFGQPFQQFGVPDLMEAALTSISNELDRVMWNLHQKEYASPFSNTGASFRCPTFTAVSYSWGDDGQPYNFKHQKTGLTISWYKWFGRGASADREITPDLASEILMDCLAAIRRIEEGKETYDEPGQYPDGKMPEQPED